MHPARRRLASLSAALIAVLGAVLALVLPPAMASAQTVPATGNGVGASHPVTILAVGVPRTVSAGEGRGEACPQPQTAAGACYAAEEGEGESIVYHGDKRSPQEIMDAGGFWPKVPGSNTLLKDYAMRNVPSNYVSTRIRSEVAEIFAGRTGYVYGISTRGLPGVSVNDVLGTTWEYAWQQEIAVPGGIPWENVESYYTSPVWPK